MIIPSRKRRPGSTSRAPQFPSIDASRSSLGSRWRDAVLCVLLLLGAGAAHAVPYTSFEGDTYELTPWEGTNIVVLTRDADLDPTTMRAIVETLDDAWSVYKDLTGRRPRPIGRTTLNGRSTIAEVPDGETCGAGCAYLGSNGIEIATTYWDILYDGVRRSDRYDQVLFYEFGRNFWFYGLQLDAVGTTGVFATGFAIANRFVSMAEIGVAGAPFGTLDFEEFERLANDELLAAYIADETLDWRNTLAADRGVPGQRFDNAASLAGAMLHRIYTDHGFAGYRSFWRELNDLASADTAEEAMANLITAAYLALGQDYRVPFKATDVPAAIPTSRSVAIDIRPWSRHNVVNPRARGRIRVALLSDVDTAFDPLQTDIATLRFGPEGAEVIRHRVRDTNRDGLPDLVLTFAVSATGIACGDTAATLRGRTHDGQDIVGSDALRTIRCGRGAGKARGVPRASTRR